VTVCRLAADDWQAYRAIRLAMLQESPSAFGSTHATEAAFDEATWRQRLTDNAVFVADLGGVQVGSATHADSWLADPTEAYLVGMWVSPAARGSGAGPALVDAVIAQARASGKRRVILDVVESNNRARALYERCGFVATGRMSPHRPDDRVNEVEMELVLQP
jgi:ribosomal protein S18 acetylase RimI-like enzyme